MSDFERRRAREFRSEVSERRRGRDGVRIVVLLRAVRSGPPAGTLGPGTTRTVAARSAVMARILDDCLGPCDQAALEAALLLREQVLGNATVTILTAVGAPDDDVLTRALERGADRAVTIVDKALSVVDYQGIAQTLAQAASNIGFDLVLCGERSIDESQGVVGPAVAELLGIAHVSDVRDLRVDRGGVRFERREQGYVRVLRTPLPALLTVSLEAPTTTRLRAASPVDANANANAEEDAATEATVVTVVTDVRKTTRALPAIETLELADIGLSAQEILHRERYLGRTFPVRVGRKVTILGNAGELVARLRTERLID